MSGRLRHALFALVAVVGVPLASLGLVEGALRLAGWGYDPRFFVPRRVDGGAFLAENPRFGWRFFPKAIARGPQRFLVAREKPEGVRRVFVLGESAAMGDPSPAYGIPRMLQAMLESARPDQRFEVVNAAMTAISSHVIRVIGAECLRHDADALVIYAGNNEVVGPFGVGSVFGIPGADRALVRAMVAVREWRLGQLADALAARLRPPPPAWTGMEAFLGTRLAFEDPRLPAVAAAYRSNLEDVCERAQRRGVPVILATVAVNLRDGGPFGAEDPAPDVAEAWRTRVAEGDRAWAAGDTNAARVAWGAAADLDGRPADLDYRIGHALLDEDPARARERFAAARDRDVLRFRSDSRLEGELDALAAARAGRGVTRVDVRAAIEAASPHGIPGHETLDDHVHFNFEGNWIAARAIAAELLAVLPGGSAADSARLPTREAVARRLGYGPPARYQTVTTMLGRRALPPFPAQWDAAAQTARFTAEADSLRPATHQPHAIRRALAEITEVTAAHPEDWTLRLQRAELLARTGNLPAALAERELACRRLPWDADVRYGYAETLRQAGREEDAARELEAAIDLFPGHFLAHDALGELLAERGDLPAAERHFREAVLRYPEFATAFRSLGDVLLRQGRPADALVPLRRAVELQPALAGAHKRLGDALFELDRPGEAEAAWQQAVAIHPGFAAAHARLADLYRARGDATRAGHHEAQAQATEREAPVPGEPPTAR